MPVSLPSAAAGIQFTVLAQPCPQVLSRTRLVSALYGFGEELESNAIEVHIHHLRRKLGESLIHTVRGVGYFIARDDSAADQPR